METTCFDKETLQLLQRRAGAAGRPGEGPDGWTVSENDPTGLVRVFKTLRIKPGFKLMGFQFRAGWNGNGVVYAFPLDEHPDLATAERDHSVILETPVFPDRIATLHGCYRGGQAECWWNERRGGLFIRPKGFAIEEELRIESARTPTLQDCAYSLVVYAQQTCHHAQIWRKRNDRPYVQIPIRPAIEPMTDSRSERIIHGGMTKSALNSHRLERSARTQEGKTPVLKADEARQLLDSIKTDSIIGLRDRAIIGLMCYTFVRVSAVVHMRVEDYYQNGKRWWIRLHEKGGKRHEVPAHHNAEAYVDAYLDAAGVRDEKKGPLFRSVDRERRITLNPITRTDVLRMVKRRALAAGLPYSTSCHTFRATGITAYLENGGTIENAQAIAAHESPRTTKLYDRTSDEITLDEVERIVI